MEFSRPEYWSGKPFPSPGDLPNPGIEPRSPALQADSLPAEPAGEPKKGTTQYYLRCTRASIQRVSFPSCLVVTIICVPPLGRASRGCTGRQVHCPGGRGATAWLLGALAPLVTPAPTGPLPGARDPSAWLLGAQLGGWVLGSKWGEVKGLWKLTLPLATLSDPMTTRTWVPTGQVTFQVPRGWGGEDRPSAPRMAAALGPLCKCPFIKPSSSCPKEGPPVSWAWGDGGHVGAQETLGVQSRRGSGQSPLLCSQFPSFTASPCERPCPSPPAVPPPCTQAWRPTPCGHGHGLPCVQRSEKRQAEKGTQAPFPEAGAREEVSSSGDTPPAPVRTHAGAQVEPPDPRQRRYHKCTAVTTTARCAA